MVYPNDIRGVHDTDSALEPYGRIIHVAGNLLIINNDTISSMVDNHQQLRIANLTVFTKSSLSSRCDSQI